MDELHAAIAAHLSAQRCRLAATAARDSMILAIWYERSGVPHCHYYGKPINDDDGGLYNLAAMQRVRECALHYAPF